jgi:GTPase
MQPIDANRERTASEALASEAHAEHERLTEARFFVACLGQFKRGKSTLINALVLAAADIGEIGAYTSQDIGHRQQLGH